ncbi:MAG TPA: hypothetical protein VNU65_14305 [Xanthobacteraceae bacterium]|nr:hypothetical protein [Xanthobacteraceae bacterium]
MARASGDDRDKALWLTLAQSWVRLAEHVARDDMDAESQGGEEMLAAHASQNS